MGFGLGERGDGLLLRRVSFSSRPMGARHRYRLDHGIQGPGDLDADVRINQSLVLLFSSSGARFQQLRLGKT